MFDHNNMDAMAQAARESLKKQKQEVNPNVNYYQDMMDESEQDNQSYDIKRNPATNEQRPNIHNTPGQDYYEQDIPEINEFDQPIFPGGPLLSQINSWKKQYEGYDVYVTNIGEQYFVFRTLNRFEYKQIVSLQNTDPLMREEIICETCTLWPSEYKWDRMATGKAGVPSTYSQIIMEKSGFTKEYAIQVL